MLDVNDQQLSVLLDEIKRDFDELKKCDHPPIQQLIIATILPKCDQVLLMLGSKMQRSLYASKYQNIQNIKRKAEQIDRKIKEQGKMEEQIGNGGRYLTNNSSTYNKTDNQKQAERQKKLKIGTQLIIKTIALEQIKSVNLKISNEQLEKILNKMENNAEVMKFTEQYLKKQGQNLELVEEDIQKALANAKQMNETLQQANQEQIQSIHGIQKIFRTTASGLWGAIKWPFKLIFRRNKQ